MQVAGKNSEVQRSQADSGSGQRPRVRRRSVCFGCCFLSSSKFGGEGWLRCLGGFGACVASVPVWLRCLCGFGACWLRCLLASVPVWLRCLVASVPVWLRCVLGVRDSSTNEWMCNLIMFTVMRSGMLQLRCLYLLMRHMHRCCFLTFSISDQLLSRQRG